MYEVGEFVYIFFREVSVEHSACGKVILLTYPIISLPHPLKFRVFSLKIGQKNSIFQFGEIPINYIIFVTVRERVFHVFVTTQRAK